MKILIPIFSLLLVISVFATHADSWFIVDEFGKCTNDGLLARVDNFQKVLKEQKSKGLVILYGPTVTKYLNRRRIEGCNLMRRYSSDSLKFAFDPDGSRASSTQFYVIPKDYNLKTDAPDYKLTDLSKAVELNSAFGTDEFCPLHFYVEWYSAFMTANPTFRGKVVIDSSLAEFNRRAVKHRNALKNLGIDPQRVRFIRQHFAHERDEQWWLIPSKKG